MMSGTNGRVSISVHSHGRSVPICVQIHQRIMPAMAKNEVDGLYCPICNEIMMDGMYLRPCGHNFCNSCISNWLVTRGKNTCPICRHDAIASDIAPCSLLRFVLQTAQSRHGNLQQTSEGLDCEASTRQKLEETLKYVSSTFCFGLEYTEPKLVVIPKDSPADTIRVQPTASAEEQVKMMYIVL